MDWVVVFWGAGDNHDGVGEIDAMMGWDRMMGWSTLRRSWGNGRGADPMMGWDRIISLGQDGMWIMKIGLRIRWVHGLNFDAIRLWASIRRGLDHFVYSDLTITIYSQFS